MLSEQKMNCGSQNGKMPSKLKIYQQKERIFLGHLIFIYDCSLIGWKGKVQ